jgi:hypothetical protein
VRDDDKHDPIEPMTEENQASSDVEEPTPPAAEDADPAISVEDVDEGPVRRPLIRATLPHIEGSQPTPRDPPVFTMHQQHARPSSGQGRGGNWNGRSGRDNGNSTKSHSQEGGQPGKKKPGSQRRRASGGTSDGNNGASGNKWPSRSEPNGTSRSTGNRRPAARRDKGRSRQ